MILIDAHLDLAWNALNWNRDLTQPVSEIRRLEADMKEKHRGQNTLSFPEMKKADLAVCLATVLTRVSSLNEPLLDYRSREIASAMGWGHVAYYRIMESEGQMRMLKDWPALDRHIQEWKKTGGRSTPLGFILAMEGADPILSPREVEKWWQAGLRVVEIVHFGVSAYAHGTGAPGGLTPMGRDLLKAMQEVGMVLDVTHLADDALWEALEVFEGPVIASHHNCRALVPGDRQLTDEQIRALIKRDAVIGTAFDAWMLYPGYVPDVTPNTVVGMEASIDHIDRICQMAGNARHVAIGSDLDGGFGKEQSPRDLETIADLQRIPDMLRKRGYREPEIEGVMHLNWLRFFQKAWTRRQQ